jgi:hypothetical protein
VIRTLGMGSVEFQRGQERLGLGPDTQVQIYDRVRARPFTTVKQYFGTVTVEAEVQDVQHFAVQNNYLAAVVKGTRFTVTADADSASVAVARGAVFVEDRATGNDVTVTVGQTASVDGTHGAPTVTGKGTASGSDDNPAVRLGRGKPDMPPGKPEDPGKPAKDTDNPGMGDENSGKGKPDNDNSGKGKSGDTSNSGKSDDNSGKGSSDDEKSNGKNDDKSKGRGKSDDD